MSKRISIALMAALILICALAGSATAAPSVPQEEINLGYLSSNRADGKFYFYVSGFAHFKMSSTTNYDYVHAVLYQLQPNNTWQAVRGKTFGLQNHYAPNTGTSYYANINEHSSQQSLPPGNYKLVIVAPTDVYLQNWQGHVVGY
ncbi:hypothetical protein ACU063_21330 [Paenibacillus sp. M.A.Huq-81]